MKNNPPKKTISTADTERALNDALRLDASVFPQTDEDIEALEAETDPTLAPTPDVIAFKKLLAQGGTTKPTSKTNIVSFESAEHSEMWAIAARNGAEITPEVQAKMAAARAAAKAKKQSK